jgi:DNA-binding response OmpR family regulator
MARALTGPRMQGRLLDLLRSQPRRVWTTDELCKALRLQRGPDVDALARATRAECRRGGCPYPTDVWGVGYRLSDTDSAQQTLAAGVR